MKQNNFTEIALIFLFVILIHSYVPTILEILSNGANADFNWTPAKCVFKGINHYSSYLMGDGKCYKDMSQYGEYAPGFYILIYPYTLFDWTTSKILWALTNIILIFLTTYLLCKKFEVNKIFTLLITIFLLKPKAVIQQVIRIVQEDKYRNTQKLGSIEEIMDLLFYFSLTIQPKQQKNFKILWKNYGRMIAKH